MAQIITDNQYYANIADAIREKNGETTLYKPSEMANAIMNLSSLNFEVVGGTLQPKNPKENTIWVNTEQEITGWSFSYNIPDSTSEGVVWFMTASYGSAGFSAIKGNDVFIYPVLSKQYINENWVEVPSRLYVNREWKDWSVDVDITVTNAVETYAGGSYTIAKPFVLRSSGANCSNVYVAYRMDLTNVNGIRVHFTERNHTSSTTLAAKSGIGILDSLSINDDVKFWNGTFLASNINNINGEATLSVSTRELTGEKVVWIGLHGTSDGVAQVAYDSIKLFYSTWDD